MADIAQIQIVPVDNGYFIQVVNADGSGQSHPRKVANSREELVERIKELAEGLYTKEPPALPSMAQPQSPPPAQS
jgi:hypothetical protein